MSTHDTVPDLEQRLRAALTARADLVQPEDVAPLAPAVSLRPRWQSPWVLLATAAVVLLVLGVVLQGVGRDQRSDDVAPKPDEPVEPVELELPPDVGRDWEPATLSRPPRLDLDGDGAREEVTFLAEPTEELDGRFRMQTTLSTTGEEAYGIAEVGTTIDTNVLDPIDADGDGDQELVLYHDDPTAVGGGGHPLVFDLREGMLVRAAVDEPDLLVRGDVPVPGSRTEHYELVRQHDYWIDDGTLWSSRSVNAFAAGNMTIVKPETVVLEAWSWRLTGSGLLEPVGGGCVRERLGERLPCEDGAVDDLPPVSDVAEETFGVGEQAEYGDEDFGFTARLRAVADPSLVVEGTNARPLELALEVGQPRVNTTQPTGIFYDGASFVVTSAADPGLVQVVVQRTDGLRVMQPVGEVPLRNDEDVRTWLTGGGALVTAVREGDAWRTWWWQMVSGSEIAALPGGEVCFDDVEDPSTARQC